jgi:putative Mg2+ transporter-C (MgtC) family protein
MTLDLQWSDVAIRLALTVLASALIGFNRSESGRAAGLRTTMLVGLAACTSMIQVNFLLSLRGKASDSFNALDLMRLPLGILTGMGFIGGGVILRRGDTIHGVTTAASLWLATVIGLCLGGGQLGLGIVTLAIAMVILKLLKWFELRIRQDRRGVLTLSCAEATFLESGLQTQLRSAGFGIESWEVSYRRRNGGRHSKVRCQLRWRARIDQREVPTLIKDLAERPHVLTLSWRG